MLMLCQLITFARKLCFHLCLSVSLSVCRMFMWKGLWMGLTRMTLVTKETMPTSDPVSEPKEGVEGNVEEEEIE